MKRSAQVALLLGGLTTVGAGAYAMAPARQNCAAPGAQPAPAAGLAGLVAPLPGSASGAAGPAAGALAPGAQPTTPCRSSRRYSSYGGGYYGSRGYSGSRTIWGGWSSPRTSTSSRPGGPGVALSGRSGSSAGAASPSSGSSTGRAGFGSTASSAGHASS